MPTDATLLSEQLLRQLGPSSRPPLAPERTLALMFQVVQLARQLEGWPSTQQRGGGAGAGGGAGGKNARGMLARIESLDRDMDKYEDPELLDFALSLLPLQDLYDQAEQLLASPSGSALSHTDALVKSLATWFKSSFFTWIDPIKYPLHPHDPLEMAGNAGPTESEAAFGAGRVELWKSPRDGRVVRFARYNNPKKVLIERTGRCGEWANAFCACLRALGVRTRYILNTEDHVWAEYFSQHEGQKVGRWVHVDPCEASTDQPLVYALGWQKNMRYCLAFSTSGCADVTARYVPSLAPLLRPGAPGGVWRDQISESELASALQAFTRRRRLQLTDEERRDLEAEDIQERKELSVGREAERVACAEAAGLGKKERTSGTLEWRKVRGEATGKAVAVMPPRGDSIFGLFSQNSTAPSIQLNGSASSTPNSIVLTHASPSQTSSAFFPIPDLPAIMIQFTFRITPPEGGDGADGMAFVIHSDPRGSNALGGGGSDLGYAGIQGGWALELDCYRSQDTCDDPPTPHISLHASTSPTSPLSAHHRSSLACTSPDSLPPLTDGRPYALRVVYNRRAGSAQVWLTDAPDGQDDQWELLFEQSLPEGLEMEGKQLWAGWTASTGGLVERHEVLKCEAWRLGAE